MKNLKVKEFRSKLRSIPEAVGLFEISGNEKTLFVKSSENLRKFLLYYCDNEHENKNIQELSDLAESISYMEYDSLIEAFIHELIRVDKQKPAYNSLIKPWYDYLYLGVSFKEPPYLKISHDTLSDCYYIGPFRSSFVLNDILDTFAELFKLPRCIDENFPCDRLNGQQCLGYCQNKLGEALPEVLNRLIMVPNKEAIQRLNIKYDQHLNDLEFVKAENLKNDILLLKKYYKNLLFSYTSHYITGEYRINDSSVFIKNGLIEEVVSPDGYLKLIHPDLSYRRPNELLAFPKDEYDHRWIVYNFVYNTEPETIENLFMENVVELQKSIFSEINLEEKC